MRAGRLRHLLTVQKITEADDGYGGTTETWADYKTRRAMIRSLSGLQPARERMYLGQVMAEATHQVHLRYDSTITSDMRFITHDDRTLHILGIGDPDGRRRELVAVCKEEL